MNIKTKITNLVNIFITDPENAEKAYYSKTAHWNNNEIEIFWRLISKNEYFKPIFETAREFLDYLVENEVVTPEEIVTEFKYWYKDEGYRTDVGLVTFTEAYLADVFFAKDIAPDEEPELYEKVKQAETLLYWRNILTLAAQETICCNDFFENVVECL